MKLLIEFQREDEAKKNLTNYKNVLGIMLHKIHTEYILVLCFFVSMAVTFNAPRVGAHCKICCVMLRFQIELTIIYMYASVTQPAIGSYNVSSIKLFVFV